MSARVFLILTGALLVLLTFTYPQWQPMLSEAGGRRPFPGLSEAENEVFQLLSAEQRADFRQLLNEDQEMAVAMVRAALRPDTVVPPEHQAIPPMLAPVPVAFGEFLALDAVRWASGNFILYREADAASLLRLENFRSSPGPDLRVLLAVAPMADDEGVIMSESWDSWRLSEPFLDLGALRGTVGNQNFSLAPDVDLEQFSLVIIYSAEYGLLISPAIMQFN